LYDEPNMQRQLVEGWILQETCYPILNQDLRSEGWDIIGLDKESNKLGYWNFIWEKRGGRTRRAREEWIFFNMFCIRENAWFYVESEICECNSNIFNEV